MRSRLKRWTNAAQGRRETSGREAAAVLGGYKLGTGCLPTFSGAPAMHTMTFGQGRLTSCRKGMGAVWALGGAAGGLQSCAAAQLWLIC